MLFRTLFRAILTLAVLLVVPHSVQAACTFTLNPPSATFTNASNDAVVQVSASASTCAWTAASQTSWITVSFGSSGTGNGSVGFTVLQNNTFAQRTGSLKIAGITFSVTQAGAPCTYSLSPNNATVPGAGANGSFNVSSGCSWTATSNNSDWLTATGSATGNGTVTYSAVPNADPASRIGTISVGTQTFTVTQTVACTFTLNPPSAAFSNASNDSVVQVSANASSCAWTASSQTPWIAISLGSSGSGNGSVGFTVLQNPTFSPRAGSLKIAGITFPVTQAGAPCTYNLSPNNATVSAAGANGSFNVSSGCSWTATSNNDDWLTAVGFGTGNGSVSYSAAPNQNFISRTGTISIGTQNFTVTQTAACNFTVNPVSAQINPSGGSGTFQVQPSASSCAWTAASNNPDFITVTSGASGTGNGTIGYTVSANTATDPRGGSIAVGNTAFGVYQPGGAACSYAFAPSSASYSSSGGSGAFSVSSACPWTPTTLTDWITIVGPASSTGKDTVVYVAAPNPTSAARSGAITIGGSAFTIAEAGVPCTVTVSQNAVSAPAAGLTGAIAVTAPDSCNWNASTAANWIALAPAGGSGQGSVSYAVAASTLPKQRTAAITIANQIVNVVQDAAACNPTLTPGQASVPAGAGTYTFHISTGCDYAAVANTGWIKIVSGGSGTGESDVAYTVSANSSSDARTGSITAGGLNFSVSQSGTSCSLSLNPTSANVPSSGGSGVIDVTATNSCRWNPGTDSAWIKLTYALANGSGKVYYTVDSATDANPRVGNILVSGQTFSVTQDGQPPARILAVVNSASFLAGPVAPGEIVAIFGNSIGPGNPVSLQLSADGQLITSVLAQTRVLFDGTAAPLLYVSDGQIAAIVPYEVAAQKSTQVQVEYQGVASSPFQLDVAPSAPALFTLASSGSGQGAILNQNLSGNDAAHPAAKGSVIVLYATGEGQTKPPGVNGKLVGAVPPQPMLPVTVQIGGINAAVQYAGGAPGLTAGVLQVNVRVPPQTPSGAVPVVLRVGTVSSQPNVTLRVQ